jgi:hypothetical protein
MQSEWMKTRRSAAFWLSVTGGFFLPVMFLIGFLLKHHHIDQLGLNSNAWMALASKLWQFRGLLLLPMGIVLAASLIMQIEYRNNGWKQLHTTPQSPLTIFSAKLLTLILMTLTCFLYFNTGMLLAGVLPSLIFTGRLPKANFPVYDLVSLNAKFFLAALPILTFQYLLSLLFKNFLVPIGIGILLIIASLLLLEVWEHAYWIPYAYCQMIVMNIHPEMNIYYPAAAYSIIFTVAAYICYHLKQTKG